MANDLSKLADQINAEHAEVTAAMRHVLGRAQVAGSLLIQVKSSLKHGEFRPWLRDNFDGSERTARLYMNISNNWDALSKTATVADLTFREAVKIIQDLPREGAKPIEQKCKACGHSLVRTSDKFAYCVNCFDSRLVPVEPATAKEKSPSQVAADLRRDAERAIRKLTKHDDDLQIAEKQWFVDRMVEFAAASQLSITIHDEDVSPQTTRDHAKDSLLIHVYDTDEGKPVQVRKRKGYVATRHWKAGNLPHWLSYPERMAALQRRKKELSA